MSSVTSEISVDSLNVSTNKFSKTYKFLFFLLHIVYDLDFGFIERRTPRSKFIVKILTLAKCVCVCAVIQIFTYSQNLSIDYLIYYSYINVFYLVTVLSFSHEASFYRLQSDMFSIDAMIDYTGSFNIETKITLAILVFHLISIVPASIEWYQLSKEENSSWAGPTIGTAVAIFGTTNTINTVHVMCFFMFYTVYCRLRVFVQKIKINRSQIMDSLDVYKAMLDALDRVKKSFDFLYASALVFQTTLIVSGVFLNLLKVKETRGIVIDYVLLDIVRIMILLFAPAISAGLITLKAEELERILQDRLLYERNEPHSGAIELFLEYVHARPMEFKVFKVIPLDWSLPVYILNLCITYQIAIVQLTHLY